MNQLKQISIRGRFAIGLTCAKLLLREKGLLHNLFYRNLIERIGSFTKFKDLGIWDAEHRFYCYTDNSKETGSNILKKLQVLQQSNEEGRKTKWGKETYVPLEILNLEFYNKLVLFYQSEEHKDLKELFELCADIGGVELYGAMSNGNSKFTLKIIEQILTQTKLQEEFNFDKIAKKHPFKLEDGWGNEFDFKTFKRV